jgi:tetratricopeptide (TPR) repeat protein
MENELHMEEQILEVNKLYDDGEYVECKRKLLDMLEQEPGFGRAHDVLGWLYYVVLDDHESAVNHLRMAVKFAPNYAPAYYHYAYILNSLNRKSELRELTAKGVATEGVNKCAMYLELGKSFEMNREYSEALEAYYEAERFAITEFEVQEVYVAMRRVIKKSIKPFKRILLALAK